MLRLLAILLALTAQALPAQVLAAWCAEPAACACCANACPCLEPAEESETPLLPAPSREVEPRWQALVPTAWAHPPAAQPRRSSHRSPRMGADPPGRPVSGARAQALLGVFLH